MSQAPSLQCTSYVAMHFHRWVWYCFFSALRKYSKFRHHPHPRGYVCAKFCFFCSLRSWASPWRKITYSINHSINHSSAYLTPGNWNFCFSNFNLCTSYLSLLTFNSLPSLHISSNLFSTWKWRKTAGSSFGVRVPRTLDYPTYFSISISYYNQQLH